MYHAGSSGSAWVSERFQENEHHAKRHHIRPNRHLLPERGYEARLEEHYNQCGGGLNGAL
jgi:hypothetical protein